MSSYVILTAQLLLLELLAIIFTMIAEKWRGTLLS